MPRTWRVCSFVFLVAALGLLVLPGCGKSPVEVKGTLVLPSDLKLADEDKISIAFTPETKGDKPGSANLSGSERSFTAKLVPGKYKVSVQISPYPGSPGSEERNSAVSALNFANSPDKTPLTYEVTGDPGQNIEVDVGKKTVTKK
jgi:hypothetical protein